MTKFESLLTTYLLTLSVGCVGTNPIKETCGGAPLDSRDAESGDIVLSVGYVAVEPGAACPAVEDVGFLDHENCCPAREFAGKVCGEAGREDGQIVGRYGYYYSSTPGEDTGVSEVVDLCLYEGLFEVTNICCGRPLLCEGTPRVAQLAKTAQWADRPLPDVSGLPEAERKALGEHWLRAALLEHASVASFARFTLDLLRWGAPPELVAQAQQAAQDEVEHARRCFALASAYLGQSLGPAEMDLGDAAALSPTFAAFVEAVVREGCVGETLSVLDAAQRLQHETDPAVRATLQQIVDDESRHAALAWATVQWALGRDPSLSARLAEVFAQERDGSAQAFREGWDRVVAPAWAALAS